MGASFFWQRADVISAGPFDTVFFDLDGTLIQTRDSFHAADIGVAAFVAGQLNGLEWGQEESGGVLTHDDVLAFKQAGGYNNDWDMCYLLAALCTARLREWRGTPLAERSYRQWAALSHAANEEGRGGLAWVRAVVPASALPDYELIGDLYRELYWGAAELRRRYGHVARYLPTCAGSMRNERPLYAPDFFRRLRLLGVRHMGIITGRIGPEVDAALEMLEAASGERWWEVVVDADRMPKPDPRALRLALAALSGPVGAALYVGDTGDDLDLVLKYRASRQESEPPVLAVSLVYPEEVALYQQRGADFVICHVHELVRCLGDGATA